MKIRAIITGATGMVGEGVLHECLLHPDVEKVLVINRKPTGVSHPKLTEVIHGDFFNLAPVENDLSGYNACYFCAGVTSVGKKEPEFYHLTYELTLAFAKTVLRLNPGMVFCYVSGGGTDSTEQGKTMWARVKGKTENHLTQLGFKKAYAFRPGFMKPTPGLKNTLKMYYAFTWMFPVLQALFPGGVGTLKDLGLAMINVVLHDYDKPILEVRDIARVAKV